MENGITYVMRVRLVVPNKEKKKQPADQNGKETIRCYDSPVCLKNPVINCEKFVDPRNMDKVFGNTEVRSGFEQLQHMAGDDIPMSEVPNKNFFIGKPVLEWRSSNYFGSGAFNPKFTLYIPDETVPEEVFYRAVKHYDIIERWKKAEKDSKLIYSFSVEEQRKIGEEKESCFNQLTELGLVKDELVMVPKEILIFNSEVTARMYNYVWIKKEYLKDGTGEFVTPNVFMAETKKEVEELLAIC